MQFKGMKRKEWKDWIQSYLMMAPKLYMPGVSVNIVVFHYADEKLNVLIMRFDHTNKFMLPGGYVLKNEDLDDSALRCFREWTGLGDRHLEQFYTSGRTDRSSDQLLNGFIENDPNGEENWLQARKISVCYYALTDRPAINPTGLDSIFSEYQWMEIHSLPGLIFDHKLIIEMAVKRLQEDLDRKIAEVEWLAEPFTMAELLRLYEVIHNRKLTRTNFQRRMLNLGVLERVGKKYQGKAHKAPFLYRMNK